MDKWFFVRFIYLVLFSGTYNNLIENITNCMSRLKQSNLTALSSTQKKVQEKSLE